MRTRIDLLMVVLAMLVPLISMAGGQPTGSMADANTKAKSTTITISRITHKKPSASRITTTLRIIFVELSS